MNKKSASITGIILLFSIFLSITAPSPLFAVLTEEQCGCIKRIDGLATLDGGAKKGVSKKDQRTYLLHAWSAHIKELEQELTGTQQKKEACTSSKKNQPVCDRLDQDLRTLKTHLEKAKAKRVRLIHAPILKAAEKLGWKDTEAVDETTDEKNVEGHQQGKTSSEPVQKTPPKAQKTN